MNFGKKFHRKTLSIITIFTLFFTNSVVVNATTSNLVTGDEPRVTINRVNIPGLDDAQQPKPVWLVESDATSRAPFSKIASENNKGAQFLNENIVWLDFGSKYSRVENSEYDKGSGALFDLGTRLNPCPDTTKFTYEENGRTRSCTSQLKGHKICKDNPNFPTGNSRLTRNRCYYYTEKIKFESGGYKLKVGTKVIQEVADGYVVTAEVIHLTPNGGRSEYLLENDPEYGKDGNYNYFRRCANGNFYAPSSYATNNYATNDKSMYVTNTCTVGDNGEISDSKNPKKQRINDSVVMGATSFVDKRADLFVTKISDKFSNAHKAGVYYNNEDDNGNFDIALPDRGYNSFVFNTSYMNFGVGIKITATLNGKPVTPMVILSETEEAGVGELFKFVTSGTPWQLLADVASKGTNASYHPFTEDSIDTSFHIHRTKLYRGINSSDWFGNGGIGGVDGLGTKEFYPVNTNMAASSTPFITTKATNPEEGVIINSYINTNSAQSFAIGFVVKEDTGDAPDSYGIARHIHWEGMPYLGRTPRDVSNSFYKDRSDTEKQEIENWKTDDNLDEADEGNSQLSAENYEETTGKVDGMDSDYFKIYNPTESTYSMNIIANPGRQLNADGTPKIAHIRGCIDFNNNGTFDESEKTSATITPTTDTTTNNNTVTLTWNNIPQTDNTDITSLGARIRISYDEDVDNPTGSVFGGEVEDFQIRKAIPPRGDKQETTGTQGQVQQATVNFTAFGKKLSNFTEDNTINTDIDVKIVTLNQNQEQELVSEYTEPNEGTYTVDKSGNITFTPLPSFVGKAKGIVLRATDTNGLTTGWTSTLDSIPNNNNNINGQSTMDAVYIPTVTQEFINISLTKNWENTTEQTILPNSIEVQLYKTIDGNKEKVGDSVTISPNEQKEWKHTFENLAKKDNAGMDIVYSVEELNVTDGVVTFNDVKYDVTYSVDGNNVNNFIITNTKKPDPKPEIINITVTKRWENLKGATPPQSIEVKLQKNNTDVATANITAENNWTYTFENIIKKDDTGNNIQYSIVETPIEGYTISIEGNSENGFTITNRRNDELINIPVTKRWENLKGSTPPTSIEVKLQKEGEDVATANITEENNWTYTFENIVKKDEKGNDINYSIVETPIEGYTISIEGNSENGFTITNRKNDELINIPVTKRWENLKGSTPPTSIEVKLQKDGVDVATANITEENNWTYTFENIVKKDEKGNDINYSIVETPIDGYTTSIEGNLEKGFTITNRKNDELINITVTKRWENVTEQTTLPNSIEVQLYKTINNNKEAVGAPITISPNEQKEWKYTFENLIKKNDDGTDIVYSIEEMNINEGVVTLNNIDYNVSYSKDENGFIITNTKKPELPPQPPVNPTDPEPVEPNQPKPNEPTQPNPGGSEPGKPTTPGIPTIPDNPSVTVPSIPTTPVVPEKPTTPVVPEKPITPVVPNTPTTPVPSNNPGGSISNIPLLNEVITDISPSISENPKFTNTGEEKTFETNAKVGNNIKKLVKKLPKTGALDSSEIIKKVGIVSAAARALIETSLPSAKTFRLAGSNDTNLNTWLEVLPEQDRNSDKYIVIPSSGLVMPINTVPENSKEYKNFVNGINENFHKYLHTGAVEIPATTLGDYGQIGNKVIAGHSSYFKNLITRYKTHFQKIIGMEKGEEIWIYKKNSLGAFDRFVYTVNASYNADDEDTSVLLPTETSVLTLFTCTPIGGVDGRWIVRADFIGN